MIKNFDFMFSRFIRHGFHRFIKLSPQTLEKSLKVIAFLERHYHEFKYILKLSKKHFLLKSDPICAEDKNHLKSAALKALKC